MRNFLDNIIPSRYNENIPVWHICKIIKGAIKGDTISIESRNMKDRDIHDFIEEQNTEIKQLIWEKIIKKIPELAQQATGVKSADKNCKSKCNKEKAKK